MVEEKIKYKYLTSPYQHQIDAHNKLYGKKYSALFLEQGTGKSKVAIDMACNLYLEKKIDAVMVIAPNGVHRQWADEQIPIHSSASNRVMIWSTRSSRYYQNLLEEFITVPVEHQLKWFCVNVDIFSSGNHIGRFKEFLLNNKTFIIVDESTRIKNPKANCTINIMYGLARVQKQGKRVVDVFPLSEYRIILTGMMVTNNPFDLWAMFEFLRHNYFGCNFYAFRARYGIEMKDTNSATEKLFYRKIRPEEIRSVHNYRAKGKAVWEIAYIMGTAESNVQYILNNPGLTAPYKHLDELKESIEPDSFIIRKEDCLDLPPKVYENLYAEMNSDQKRIYRELKIELLAEYADKELSVINKVSLMGRLQQVTGGFFPYKEDEKSKAMQITDTNPKIKILIRDLEECGDEIIIVWARFVAELKTIHKELSKAFPDKRIELYYGGTQQYRRPEIIKEFKEGRIDILVINQQTGAFGLNLQRCHLNYYFSNSYSLEDRMQSEDRTHRVGQKCSVLYKDIIIRGTVDEKVHEVLRQKKDLLDYFRSNTLESFIGG